MKINQLKKFSKIFAFKSLTDKNNNEYVLYADSNMNEIDFEIDDKTQFEAVENHIHLIDNVKKSDFDELIRIGKILGKTQLNILKNQFPEKEFCVFVTVDVGESMIIRFHQIWENEPIYYNLDDFNTDNSKVLMFKR